MAAVTLERRSTAACVTEEDYHLRQVARADSASRARRQLLRGETRCHAHRGAEHPDAPPSLERDTRIYKHHVPRPSKSIIGTKEIVIGDSVDSAAETRRNPSFGSNAIAHAQAARVDVGH